MIEADIYNASSNPSQERICFWLTKCRTPELLVSLVKQYSEIASRIAVSRPLLNSAIKGNQEDIERPLREEEDKEIELGRQYWD